MSKEITGSGFESDSYVKSRYKEMWKDPASKMMTSMGKMPVIFGKYAREYEELKSIVVEAVQLGMMSPQIAYLFWEKVLLYYKPLILDHIQKTILKDNPSAVMGVLSADEGVGITKKDEVAEVISKCSRLQGSKSIGEIDRRCKACGQIWKDITRMNRGQAPKCPIFQFQNAFFDIITPPSPNTFEAMKPLRFPESWLDVWLDGVFSSIDDLKRAYYRPITTASKIQLEMEQFNTGHPLGIRLTDVRLELLSLTVALKTLMEEKINEVEQVRNNVSGNYYRYRDNPDNGGLFDNSSYDEHGPRARECKHKHPG